MKADFNQHTWKFEEPTKLIAFAPRAANKKTTSTLGVVFYFLLHKKTSPHPLGR